MEHEHDRGAPSTAAIRGHPVHPMLIPFPIAFLPAALVTDLIFWGTGDAFWAQASVWLVLAGFVTGLLAAGFGLTDFVTIRRARQHRGGWVHFLGNGLVIALALGNLLWRWGEPVEGAIPGGIVISALTTGLLVITGWYGGELSYRHRIGMVEHNPDPPPSGS